MYLIFSSIISGPSKILCLRAIFSRRIDHVLPLCGQRFWMHSNAGNLWNCCFKRSIWDFQCSNDYFNNANMFCYVFSNKKSIWNWLLQAKKIPGWESTWIFLRHQIRLPQTFKGENIFFLHQFRASPLITNYGWQIGEMRIFARKTTGKTKDEYFARVKLQSKTWKFMDGENWEN